MKRNLRKALPMMAASFFCVLAFAGTVSAQHRTTPQGVPQDWSQRQVVYANPDTPEEAARKGRTAQWQRHYRDPRFVVALMRKLKAQSDAAYGPIANTWSEPFHKHPKTRILQRDWSTPLGGVGGVGAAGVYPAKYSFSLTAAPDCANDFVVFTTANGTDANEKWTGSFIGTGTPAGTIAVGSGTMTATGGTSDGTHFHALAQATLASRTTNAVSLAAALHAIVGTTGIDATSSGATVTFTNVAVGNVADNLIANTNLSLFTTPIAHTTDGRAEASIIAFNNVYKTTCGSVVPTVFWAYHGDAAAIVRTSPVISYYDSGKQVAFVQSTGGVASLVLLKWSSVAPGTSVAPTTPAPVTPANYRSCTEPCMTVMTLSGNPDDSFSSPYVDYYGDTIWLGANNGTLHEFTGVFNGTPAEVITGGFPATVSAGNALSSPVYDFDGAQVFVGSARSATAGGMLHRVDPGTGVVTSSAQLAINSSTGVRASPILDSSARRVYTFVFDDGVVGDDVTCNATVPCQAVTQFDTAFSAGNAGVKTRVGSGNGGAPAVFYSGTFDDAYYSNAAPTGAMYVCGSDPADSTLAVLWKIPITNNVMGAPIRGASVSATGFGADCSPLSEVKNGSHDYLYFSLPDHASDGTATVCGTGLATDACLYMFDLSDLNGTAVGTSAAWDTSSVPFAGLPVAGGTGAIVIDNVSNVTGASQVYFSSLTNPGSAIQVSQAALQ